MLVLTRSADEEICIGGDIRVRVLSVQGGHVRLGIEAPRGVPIHRAEILAAVQRENEAAANHGDEARELVRSIAQLAASAPTPQGELVPD
jgi:carbon storage regulator